MQQTFVAYRFSSSKASRNAMPSDTAEAPTIRIRHVASVCLFSMKIICPEPASTSSSESGPRHPDLLVDPEDHCHCVHAILYLYCTPYPGTSVLHFPIRPRSDRTFTLTFAYLLASLSSVHNPHLITSTISAERRIFTITPPRRA